MKLVVIGSRYFGATVLEALRREDGVQVVGVVAPGEDDRLAASARAAGLPLHIQASPKVVGAEALPVACDLIIAAHTHARVNHEALARARLGGVGYHPSLLPRHRGIAAVEWTLLAGDAIAGGSVYHLADGWDAGAIAAQDWCFVAPDDSARSLWERELAPMGLRLLADVVRHAHLHGSLPAKVQDQRYATRAPMLRQAVVLTPGAALATTSLVATVVGTDRPGIVRILAERAQRHGASWTVSRMARAAGEFAGMVQLEVPQERAALLAEALRGLESTGLKVNVATGAAPGGAGTASLAPGWRAYDMALEADDRTGIVAALTQMLVTKGISIERLSTDVQSAADSGPVRFKVAARLLLPASVGPVALRAELGQLARTLTADVQLGEASVD